MRTAQTIIKQLIILAGLLGCLTACSGVKHDRYYGYDMTERSLEQLEVGKTTLQEAEMIMGSPTAVSLFSAPNSGSGPAAQGAALHKLYYIHQSQEQYAFFRPRVVTQEVIELKFTKEGVLAEVTRHQNQNNEVNFADEGIVLHGSELGLWQQFIGNIGKYSYKAKPHKFED